MQYGLQRFTAALALGMSGLLPTFGHAQSASTAIADALYNVRDFGAVGDGKTDDTRAFQAALDAAGQAGGGVVRAPRGTYRIAGSLKVPMAVTLAGTQTSSSQVDPAVWLVGLLVLGGITAVLLKNRIKQA